MDDREQAVVKLETEFGERDEKLSRAEQELEAAVTEQRSRLEQISSMTMEQAKDAFINMINTLDDDDLFNVITFETGVETIWMEPRSANLANINTASNWVNNLQTKGSTNFNGGVVEAAESFSASDAVKVLVVLSDGVPTVGEQVTNTIRNNLMLANTNDPNRRSAITPLGWAENSANWHFSDTDHSLMLPLRLPDARMSSVKKARLVTNGGWFTSKSSGLFSEARKPVRAWTRKSPCLVPAAILVPLGEMARA